ncbi:thialysine N-epsilon-acetyltransferase-like [Ornithodoros turicata]|uniref:thialysine N-epsilon-acetyltransferase-like n=1 Tax=Ornithodoros turicata TaxID=34597 RepID=UPI003139798A
MEIAECYKFLDAVTVRPASKTDCEAILHFVRDFAAFNKIANSVSVTATELEHNMFDLRPPRFWAFVATVQKATDLAGPIVNTTEKVVGVITYHIRFNGFTLQRVLCVQDLFVAPEHRGKGLGTAMWTIVNEEAIKNRCDIVEAQVRRDNEKRAKMYTNSGAKNVSVSDGWKQFFKDL